MKKIYLIPLVVVVCLVISLVAFVNIPSGIYVGSGIQYHSSVCVYKNGELVNCGSNVLYNTGAELIEDLLGNTGSGGPCITIELCNASATNSCGEPVAAKTEAYTEIGAICGLTAADGTYASIGTGNWSVSKEFTSTCNNVLINASRIGTSGMAIDLAGNNFTLVTLQNNDKLNVTWTIWVT